MTDVPTHSRSPLSAAIRRAFRQPRFVAAAVVLAVSGLGLNAATQFLQLHFRKLPVPLRVPSLRDEATGIAAELGTTGAGRWVQISRDESLEADVEQVLGTKQHVSRDYLDTRALGRLAGVTAFDDKPLPWQREEVVAGLRKRPAEERARFVAEVRRAAPEAVVRLHVAYYTGLVDTVAHIPDRCYVADGFEPSSYELVPGPIGTLADGSPRQAGFRFINFEDASGRGRVSCSVGYLFHVNGAYESDPLAVREKLQSLLEKYGYYAKVELMVTGLPGDAAGRAAAAGAMKDFMAAALPDVERALPDWQVVTTGK